MDNVLNACPVCQSVNLVRLVDDDKVKCNDCQRVWKYNGDGTFESIPMPAHIFKRLMLGDFYSDAVKVAPEKEEDPVERAIVVSAAIDEVNKGNILIARFMGYYKDESDGLWHKVENKVQVMHLLEYRFRWDVLMPVIEKIGQIKLIDAEGPQDVCFPRTFGMPDEEGNYMFRFNGCQLHYGTTTIEAAWKAVVDFVTPKV